MALMLLRLGAPVSCLEAGLGAERDTLRCSRPLLPLRLTERAAVKAAALRLGMAAVRSLCGQMGPEGACSRLGALQVVAPAPALGSGR